MLKPLTLNTDLTDPGEFRQWLPFAVFLAIDLAAVWTIIHSLTA